MIESPFAPAGQEPFPETSLQQTARHVQEFERRVARQIKLRDKLVADGHQGAALRAQTVLTTFQESLRLARQHLEREEIPLRR